MKISSSNYYDPPHIAELIKKDKQSRIDKKLEKKLKERRNEFY